MPAVSYRFILVSRVLKIISINLHTKWVYEQILLQFINKQNKMLNSHHLTVSYNLYLSIHVLVFTTCLPVSWFNLFTFCPVYPQFWSTCSLWRTILSRCLPFSTRRLRAKAFTSSAIGSVFRKCTASATPSAAVMRHSLHQRCHPNRDNWWELDHITAVSAAPTHAVHTFCLSHSHPPYMLMQCFSSYWESPLIIMVAVLYFP